MRSRRPRFGPASCDGPAAASEEAYARIIEPHRSELRAHCRAILRSTDDAEDALQEALLRAWKGLSGFEGRSSLRSWLYTIATNESRNILERRRRRWPPESIGGKGNPRAPFAESRSESAWIEGYPGEPVVVEDRCAAPDARYERRESVELAFIVALQHLPPNQRAVLILREVFGFSAQEVAETLETTIASVNSALQRARRAADERLPGQSHQETLRSIDDERVRELVLRYVGAWERGDVEAIVSMLAEEVTGRARGDQTRVEEPREPAPAT